MPAIIDYSLVLAGMTSGGFRCNYPNGGSFSPPGNPLVRGWITAPDATIRAETAQHARIVPHPADIAARAMREVLRGLVWVMPAAHWHFELHDGSHDWLPGALRGVGIDPGQLENRADGSAIEFAEGENGRCHLFLDSLLKNLRSSEFVLAFPGRPVICLVHHHRQLWWTTSDAALLASLDALVIPDR